MTVECKSRHKCVGEKKNIFHSCFFNFQFCQASLLHSPWLLPFSICPWGGRSYGPCRLRRKGCYSPVTLTRSASSPALIYGHRGGVELSWCTIGFQCCHPHPDAQTHTTFTTPSRPFKTAPLHDSCWGVLRGPGVWHDEFEVTPKGTRSSWRQKRD